MTTSLIDLLRDTLPIHAAWSGAQANGGVGDGFPSANGLAKLMRFLKPQNIAQPRRVIPPKGIEKTAARQEQFLWSWKMNSSTEFADIQCRNSSKGYALYQVANRIVFGMQGQPEVRVELPTGVVLNLPIHQAACAAQAYVWNGYVPKGRRTMWPLEAAFDNGVVQAFVFQPSVDASGNILQPVVKNGKFAKNPLYAFKGRGPGKWQPVRQQEYQILSSMVPEGTEDPDAWLEMMTGPIMNKGNLLVQTSAKTTQTKTVSLTPPRIVVALSFGTCRERADFEPGGVVSMAKLFPTVSVWASFPIRSIWSSVFIERPATTTKIDNGNGSNSGCECDAHPEINSLLVADANEIGSPLQLPFWGGTFAYVAGGAHKRYAGQVLNVVARWKNTPRTYPNGTRYLVRRGWNSMTLDTPQLKGVQKVAGQGEFDNIHLAPQLKLDIASASYSPTGAGAVVPGAGTASEYLYQYTVDPDACETRRVWMAPFCATDCFHMHWRWGSQSATTEWVRGWDWTGPYKVAGAPMVPCNQNVMLEMTSPTSFYYHAQALHDDNTCVSGWHDILCHHGVAYAQDITSILATVSLYNVYNEDNYAFFDSNKKRLTTSNMSFMYWLMRFIPTGENATPWRTGTLKVTQRVALTEDELEGARKA
jgi:hypothetical protein